MQREELWDASIMQASAGLIGASVTGRESHGELRRVSIGVDMHSLQEGTLGAVSGEERKTST
jgi:hypothetical protein